MRSLRIEILMLEWKKEASILMIIRGEKRLDIYQYQIVTNKYKSLFEFKSAPSPYLIINSAGFFIEPNLLLLFSLKRTAEGEIIHRYDMMKPERQDFHLIPSFQFINQFVLYKAVVLKSN